MPRWIARVLLVAYLAVLLDLTLWQFPQPHPEPNPIPFLSIRHDLARHNTEAFVNLIGNIVAFLPVGILVPPSASRVAWTAARVAGVALALSLAIEVAQYLGGRRVADVDDLILNTLGGLAGWGLLSIGLARVRRRSG